MRLLDTTFIIDFLRGEEEALKKAKEISNYKLFTTEINVFEILTGIYKRGKFNEEKIFLEFLGRLEILLLAGEATKISARINVDLEKRGVKIGVYDCLIAGIALTNDIKTVVTRNKEHFSRIKSIIVEGY